MASFGVFDSFLRIKTSQEWGRTLCSPWQSKLKLNYMKNPSFVELRSLFQINQVCKEENQRRNLTSNNFAWLCEIFASLRNAKRNTSCRTESKTLENEFRILCEISQALKWISKPLAKFSQDRRKFRNYFSPLAKFSQLLFSIEKFSQLLFLLWNFCNYISHLRNNLQIFFAPTPLDFYLKIFCVITYSLIVIS